MQKIPKMFKEHLRKMGLEAETSASRLQHDFKCRLAVHAPSSRCSSEPRWSHRHLNYPSQGVFPRQMDSGFISEKLG